MRRVVAGLALHLAAATAAAADVPALLTKYRCDICHAEREVLVGPAYADIAAAYRGNREAVQLVAGFIRSGARSGGPWHMPPHPEVSQAEAMALARYIVAVKPKARSQP